MPIGLTVPSACPSCDATNIVRLETTIARGMLHLCWCCNACGHDWPVTERDRGRQTVSSCEIETHAPVGPVSATPPPGLFSNMIRRQEDRRRIARGGRRASDRLSLTPKLRAEAAEYGAASAQWLNTLTAALEDGDLVGARAASKTFKDAADKLSALLTVSELPESMRFTRD
jgi:hypothetical protein